MLKLAGSSSLVTTHLAKDGKGLGHYHVKKIRSSEQNSVMSKRKVIKIQTQKEYFRDNFRKEVTNETMAILRYFSLHLSLFLFIAKSELKKQSDYRIHNNSR